MIGWMPIHGDNPLAWGLMPALRERVLDFCRKHAPEMDGDKLWEIARSHFVAPSPAMLMLAWIRDGKLVGHDLVEISPCLGKKYLVVLQRALDAGSGVTAEQVRGAMDWLESWAGRPGAGGEGGACGWRCIANTPRLARTYRTFYGFEGEKVYMTKDFKGSKGESKAPPEGGGNGR